jgi:hypothetical protein
MRSNGDSDRSRATHDRRRRPASRHGSRGARAARGAKFPELIVVLQGYGVTIDLHGETFINKEGVTSSTFRSVPDEPVTSFELTFAPGTRLSADHVHRPERHGDQTEHADQRHRVREDEEGKDERARQASRQKGTQRVVAAVSCQMPFELAVLHAAKLRCIGSVSQRRCHSLILRRLDWPVNLSSRASRRASRG